MLYGLRDVLRRTKYTEHLLLQIIVTGRYIGVSGTVEKCRIFSVSVCPYRYLLHVSNGDVYNIGHHYCSRLELSPQITGHVRDAALGKSTNTFVCISLC